MKFVSYILNTAGVGAEMEHDTFEDAVCHADALFGLRMAVEPPNNNEGFVVGTPRDTVARVRDAESGRVLYHRGAPLVLSGRVLPLE